MAQIFNSIRASLLAIVSLLCLSTIVLAGREALDSWGELADARQLVSSNKTSDLLLSAAGEWAVERAITNAALFGKTQISGETKKAILERRERADAALAEALQRIGEVGSVDADKPVADVKVALGGSSTFAAWWIANLASRPELGKTLCWSNGYRR